MLNKRSESSTGLGEGRLGDENVRDVLAAISDGRIADAVDQFDDRFSFFDNALDIRISAKDRLTEFFSDIKEVFPDTAFEIVSLFEHGNYVVAEWRLAATFVESCGLSWRRRIPILVQGATTARIEDGKITRWCDYYDRINAHRHVLAGRYKDWVEY